jgi:hypothetical protein
LTFSTEKHEAPSHFSKRNIVRRRATNFILSLNAKQIPLEKAKELFSEYTGLFDRTTLKAYFGTKEHKATRNFRRIARYPTGTYSFKDIELTEEIPTKRGYLEKLGLVHFELRGKTWFMIVDRDAVLVPQLYKRKQLFMKNISLSPNSQNDSFSLRERARENRCEKVVSSSSILETNNNLQDEREKSVYKTVLKLNPLEKAILKAEPGEEPDRAKIAWGSS